MPPEVFLQWKPTQILTSSQWGLAQCPSTLPRVGLWSSQRIWHTQGRASRPGTLSGEHQQSCYFLRQS